MVDLDPHEVEFEFARAVFLDRDGVINRARVKNGKPYPPGNLGELEILPGVEQALARLRVAGFRLVVVSNQPDVARGLQSRAVVEEMNQWLRVRLPLDDVRVCYHDDADGCKCRKPAPGLLMDAASQLGINLSGSFMVGDRWRDVEAGRRAGCRTIFIDQGYAERQPDGHDTRVRSLTEAADWVLSQID